MKFFLTISITFFMSMSMSMSASARDAAPAGQGVLDLIPFALNDGKDMSDFMALRESFASTIEKTGATYYASVLTPLFVDRSATGIAPSFDAIWLGASRSPSDFAKAHQQYLKIGGETEKAFAEVRTNLQRMMMATEIIYRGVESSDQSNVVMLSTCSPAGDADVPDIAAELRSVSKAMAEKGSKGSTFLWHSGIGIPNGLEGKYIHARRFPDLAAWGSSMSLYRAGKFSDEMQARQKVLSCGAPRVYLSDAFHWPAD